MKLLKTGWVLAGVLLLYASAVSAQNQKQNTPPIDPTAPLQPLDTAPNQGNSTPPIGAARGVIGPYDSQTYQPSQVQPDQNTLAGAAPLTVGSLQHNVNIFDPAISISQLGQLVPGPSGGAVLTGTTVVGGSLNFNRIWNEYRLSIAYSGGETFNLGYGAASSFFGSTSPHYQFHNLAVTETADWAKWHILFQDSFAASPGAAFSAQGAGGPGLSSQFSSLMGSSLNSIAQSYLPSQTINTGAAMRYVDGVLGQVEYAFNRKSVFTVSGSYGLLHFTDSGFLGSTQLGAQAGYDYQLSPSNSVAIFGSYGRINYSLNGGLPSPGSTVDYMGALAFGRRITGRLAFQVAAGPEDILASFPGGAGDFNLVFLSVNSALIYNWRRGGVSVGYSRGLTGGSGIVLGATSNTLTATGNYQFTRNWSGSVNGGSALNDSLVPAGTVATRFYNWFAGANLGRRIGSRGQINLNYGALWQNNPATCTLALCGGEGLQEMFGLSFNWHLRQIR